MNADAASASKAPRDIFGGLLLAAISAFVFWANRDLDVGSVSEMGPGMFPMALAAFGTVIGLAVAAIGFVTAGPAVGGLGLRGPVLILAAILIFAASIRPLGLAVAGPLVVLVGGFAEPTARPRDLLVAAVLLPLFCALLFKYALRLPIPLAPWALGY